MSVHALLNRIKSVARGGAGKSIEKMLAFYHALDYVQLDNLAGLFVCFLFTVFIIILMLLLLFILCVDYLFVLQLCSGGERNIRNDESCTCGG